MKIHVDYSKCTGMGMCEAIADDVFEVTEEAKARVLQDDVPSDRRDEMEEAVDTCPTGAVSITD
ncbi:MAG TPA: ferredoxin [Pseudonocardia sp.]|jgi:ferredoxin